MKAENIKLKETLRRCRRKFILREDISDLPQLFEDIASNVRDTVRDELRNTELVRNKSCGFDTVNGKVRQDNHLAYLVGNLFM